MTYKKYLILLFASLMLASPVSAATVPVFDWVAAYNSTAIDTSAVKGTVIDPVDGSVFLSNRFSGTGDLDPTGGTDSRSSAGGFDGLLTKFDADGTYLMSQIWGYTGGEVATDVFLSEDGTLYVGGNFSGVMDSDPTVGTSYATSSGGLDAFVSLFDTDGNYQSGFTLGGSGDDRSEGVFAIATHFYLAGGFSNTVDFDPSVATSYATSTGASDMFLSKFETGSVYQWTQAFGSSSFDLLSGVTGDDDGSVFLTGSFPGTVDFDSSAGTSYATSTGSYDVFLSKSDIDGNLEWVKAWGGAGFDFLASGAVVFEDAVYVGGSFSDTVDFDPGSGTAYATSTGSGDLFISKFDTNGTFEWVKTFGGTGDDGGTSKVLIDSEGNPFLLGSFRATVDFDPSAGVDSHASVGNQDVFITHFDADGNYNGTRTFGGTLDEWVDDASLAETPNGEKLSIVGVYKSAPTDFDPSAATANFSSDGNDMYLAVFNLIEPAVTVTPTTGGLNEATGGTFDYDLVLSTPPTDDVVVSIMPDAQITVSTTSLTFASTTWDIAQTVTVSVVDDEEFESDVHTGTITHTAVSTDEVYDGISIDDVVASITENDFEQSSSGSQSSTKRTVTTDTTPQTVVPPLPQTLSPDEREHLIDSIKQQVVSLIRQLITLLQEQLADLEV